MKTRTLYQVRHWPAPTAHSVEVGSKGRLVPPPVGRRIVARLRRRGVDAFVARFRVMVTA